MLDIIIALLFAMGINSTEDSVLVVDQQTGISYGVGSTVAGGNSTTGSNGTPVYYLILDDSGEYHLVRR